MMPIDDTTLTVIFGFLLAAGSGCWKAYQWYVTRKEALKDKKTTDTLKKKNRELNALKRLNKTLTTDLSACHQEVMNLKAEQPEMRSPVFSGERED